MGQLIVSVIVVIFVIIGVEVTLNASKMNKDDKSIVRLSGVFIFLILFLIEHI